MEGKEEAGGHVREKLCIRKLWEMDRPNLLNMDGNGKYFEQF